MSPQYVGGVGPFDPNIMIIGEAPGKNENEIGQPFVGASGAFLDNCLRLAGITRSECYITNVVKYQPPFNDIKKLHMIGVDLEKSIEDLWEREIRALKPNIILAVGDLALQAVTGLSGIMKRRGSLVLAKDQRTKTIGTIHPAALFPHYEFGEAKGGINYTWAKVIQHDFRRAAEESLTSSFNIPSRQLDIANNSLDLFRFFRQYDNVEKCAVDIESINCIPVCIGFSFNRSHALSVPLLRQIGPHSITAMPENELVECITIVDKELRRLKIVGHNFKYDEYKLGLYGFETPQVVSDTLIKTRVLFPELPDKSLGTVASLWTKEPFWKDEGKEFKLGKSQISQFLLYNAKDCAVEIELDEEQEKDLIAIENQFQIPLKDYYYNYMMKKHKFYLKMENVGFRVDHEKQKELKKKYGELELAAHQKLIALTGKEINVKSPQQKAFYLYKELGFRIPRKAPTGEDALVSLIQNHCKGKDGPRKKEILEVILEETRIRDQKSRYINFSPDYDGRCKTSYNISLTETCRSSTSILQKPIRPRKMGLAFHTISKHGRLAKDIRSMFIPDKGKVFIQADSSQAEARVVAVLSRDWDLLAAFDTIDIHRRTAGLIFGMTQKLDLTPSHLAIVDDLPSDSPMRFAGKKTRHAGNYLMGKGRFQSEFNTDAQKFEINMSISQWVAGQMLEKFHAASPKLKDVFHAEIIECLKSTRTIIDPFGGIRIFNGRMDEDLFKEGFANIPQRTVAHLVQGAAIRVQEEIGYDNRDAEFIVEAHDALLMQVPELEWELYARLLKTHMEYPIDFNRYCSLRRDFVLRIPCDIEMSAESYGALKKVKLAA